MQFRRHVSLQTQETIFQMEWRQAFDRTLNRVYKMKSFLATVRDVTFRLMMDHRLVLQIDNIFSNTLVGRLGMKRFFILFSKSNYNQSIFFPNVDSSFNPRQPLLIT